MWACWSQSLRRQRENYSSAISAGKIQLPSVLESQIWFYPTIPKTTRCHLCQARDCRQSVPVQFHINIPEISSLFGWDGLHGPHSETQMTGISHLQWEACFFEVSTAQHTMKIQASISCSDIQPLYLSWDVRFCLSEIFTSLECQIKCLMDTSN